MAMTPQTLATTLALFDGDAADATVVARIVALRQDPAWTVALHTGGQRCAIALTDRATGALYRVYLDRVKRAEGSVWWRAALATLTAVALGVRVR